MAGISGGSIFVDPIGTSIGGGVVSMAAAGEWTTAGTFGGNDGVIIVHVDGVSMKGGVVTGADEDEWTIGGEGFVAIDGIFDMGFTNEDGFRTGMLMPILGRCIADGSGSANGALSP